jgi:hypothetical protein
MPLILKTPTPRKRRYSALHFAKTKSVTAVHSVFGTQFRPEPHQFVGFCGLLWKLDRTPCIFAQDTEGEPGVLTLKDTISVELSFTRAKWILNWVVPSEIVCEIQVSLA